MKVTEGMNSSQEFGCRDSPYFDSSLFLKWKNYSTFQDDFQLEAYICQFKQFLQFQARLQFLAGVSSILCSVLGAFSALLTLATLWANKHLNARSFHYFRLISLLEIFHMAHILMIGVQMIRADDYVRSYYWFWFMSCFGTNIGNMFPTAVDFVTIFLSVERALACLAPSKFSLVNRGSVTVGVSAGSVLLASALFLPQCFSKRVVMDPTTGVYSAVTTNLARLPSYATFDYFVNTFWFIMAACVTVSAALVIAGMVKSLRVKQSLRRADNTASGNQTGGSRTNDNKAHGTTRLNLQLCYLQVSQALPTALNYVLFSAYALAYSSISIGFVSISTGIGFEAALSDLTASYGAWYLKTFVVLTNHLAHSFHFYLYILFSRRFRRAFRQRFAKKGAVADADAPNAITMYPTSREGITPAK